MPKIRIVEKQHTESTIYENDNVVFLVDDSATDTPLLIKELADDDTTYERGDAIRKILNLGGEVVVCDSYENALDYLKDRNQFNVKFLLADDVGDDSATSLEGSDLDNALQIAAYRRDCVVVYGKASAKFSAAEIKLLDQKAWGESEADTTSFPAGETGSYGKYCLAFYGNALIDGEHNSYPANLAYILAFLNAKNSGNAEWLATAGAKRGLIPVTLSVGVLKESEIDSMQPRVGGTEGSHSINPIANINPWGVRIWGARTAMKIEAGEEVTASHFANIRVLLCDLKKRLYKASRTYQFEQNNDVLWVNFISSINELLEEMKQSYGIAGYKWIRGESDERAKLKASLRIVPVEPVEDFDLTIDLVDSLEVAE